MLGIPSRLRIFFKPPFWKHSSSVSGGRNSSDGICGPGSSRTPPTLPSLALGAWGALRISCLSPAPVPVPGSEASTGNVCGIVQGFLLGNSLLTSGFPPSAESVSYVTQGVVYFFLRSSLCLTAITQTQIKSNRIRIHCFSVHS